MLNAVLILLRIIVAIYALVLVLIYFTQRSLIYFPSHSDRESLLRPWVVDGAVIGYCREVEKPSSVWLVAHGNAGSAASRDYMLRCFAPDASVYVAEYPGYGARPGRPSASALNTSVADAYAALLRKFPQAEIGVVGESIGSGPACLLARNPQPPRKIVLVVPFDTFVSVAAEHMPFIIPVRWLLRDRWDNIEALKSYRGPVEIYAAQYDSVIPLHHARRLAEATRARFTTVPGDHNDWSMADISIR